MKKITLTNRQYRKYKSTLQGKREENGITFTKKMMISIIIVALIDMQFPFMLAFLGKDQIAETMGGLIVTEIIGIFLVYCLKAFFETRESEKVRLMESANNSETSNYETSNYEANSEYVEFK